MLVFLIVILNKIHYNYLFFFLAKQTNTTIPPIVKTNIPAVITGSVLDKSDSPRTSASTSAGADGTVTIETPCGQTKTYQLRAVIN